MTIQAQSGFAGAAAESRRRPRIALAHDWLCGYRGGEAVLERIAALAQECGEVAGLYVMFDDGRPLSPTVDRLREAGRIQAAPINELPGAQRLRRWMLPLYPRAVAALSQRLAREHAEAPIDLLISTSSAAIKGLRTPAGVPHLCYCHSPARYVWSQGEQYRARGWSLQARVRQAGLRAYAPRFRRWDRATAANVTQFVANSSATAALIRTAFGRDSVVIHPPVRTEFYTPDSARPRQDFWLVVSALEPYKRIDLAIAAAAMAGRRLVVSGRGSGMDELQGLAKRLGADVDFRGRTSDEELRGLYRTAGVLIYPQIEDFGISAVEAQSCGLPVAALRAGGALDTVLESRTGVSFDEQTPEAIVAAAARVPADPAACRLNAERISEREFDRRLGELMLQLLGERCRY